METAEIIQIHYSIFIQQESAFHVTAVLLSVAKVGPKYTTTELWTFILQTKVISPSSTCE